VTAHTEGSLRKLVNSGALTDRLKEKWNVSVAPQDSGSPTVVTASNVNPLASL
jgi:hypothetical protein